MKKIFEFINNNRFITFVLALMLILLIMVAISRSEMNRNEDQDPKTKTYLTKDFVVNYLSNGDIIVQSLNPKMQDINIIRKTLNLPDEAKVYLDIPGSFDPSYQDQFIENNNTEYEGDLNSVGD